MHKIERVVRRISEMNDIFMAFRRARIAAGLPVASPIDGMTNEEFEELRRRYFEENGMTGESDEETGSTTQK